MLKPAAGIDKQGKRRRVGFREAVFAESFYLLENLQCKSFVVAARRHPVDDAVIVFFESTFALPSRHGSAQSIGLPRREAGSQNADLHDLLLKDRYAERPAQRLLQRCTRI